MRRKLCNTTHELHSVILLQKTTIMSGRGKVSGSGKARTKAKTRSSKAGLQFPVVSQHITVSSLVCDALVV